MSEEAKLTEKEFKQLKGRTVVAFEKGRHILPF